MSGHPPRVAVLNDAETRLRRDWQAFTTVWQQTAETWHDKRRHEFEKQNLQELPPALNRAHAELNQFRETLQRAMRALADDEPQS